MILALAGIVVTSPRACMFVYVNECEFERERECLSSQLIPMASFILAGWLATAPFKGMKSPDKLTTQRKLSAIQWTVMKQNFDHAEFTIYIYIYEWMYPQMSQFLWRRLNEAGEYVKQPELRKFNSQQVRLPKLFRNWGTDVDIDMDTHTHTIRIRIRRQFLYIKLLGSVFVWNQTSAISNHSIC